MPGATIVTTVFLATVTAAAIVILVLAIRLMYLDDRARLMQAWAVRQNGMDLGEESAPRKEEGSWKKWKGMVTALKLTAMGEDLIEVEADMLGGIDQAV